MGALEVDATLVRLAARNNAELCDLVCRSHRLAGDLTASAWTSASRTPRYYPDAVTLAPSVDVPAMLAAIDASTGASVKDSFATLDLSRHGFRVLFEAVWIASGPDLVPMARGGGDIEWSAVTDAAALVDWERAWSDDGAPTGLFRPELLALPEPVILQGELRGDVVAGAILNRTDPVVGISNLFATSGDLAGAWAGCLAAISDRFPGCAIVGYESDDQLEVARQAGFRPIGPLRVWIND